MVVALPGVVVLVPIAVAAALGSQSFNWMMTQTLPPMMGSTGSSTTLAMDAPDEPACLNGTCVVRTTRPTLKATVPPDPDSGYHFLIYDMTGSGGTTTVAAEGKTESSEWRPLAGLLEQGHVYVWMVIGDDPEAPQDMETFTVDLQDDGKQSFDEVGPMAVGLSSGELRVELGGQTGLTAQYRTTDASGRAAGSGPLSLADGWRLGGSLLGEAPWARVETFSAEGDVVIVHGIETGATRYTRSPEDGQYHPPEIDDVDVSFSYPTISGGGSDPYVVVEPDGGTSVFDLSGRLVRYERPAAGSAAELALEVTWVGDRLDQVRDSATGRVAMFNYFGGPYCPRPPPQFTGSTHGPLCQVLYRDESTPNWKKTDFHYHGGQLARVVGDGGTTLDFSYDAVGKLVGARDPLAADLVAAGLRDDDERVQWRVAYDSLGRVESVTAPAPTAGGPRYAHRYLYEPGKTTVTLTAPGKNDVDVSIVEYEPLGWRPTRISAPGGQETSYLYDVEGNLFGQRGANGLQSSFASDDFGNRTHEWGPSPASWFDADGRPRAAHASKIPTNVHRFNDDASSHGLLTFLYDSTEPGAPVVARELVADGGFSALPPGTGASGWRALGVGNVTIPDDVDSEWRIVDPDGGNGTALSIAGEVCAAGDVCSVRALDDPEGTRVVVVWANQVSHGAVPTGVSSLFNVERRFDDGDWEPFSLAEARGLQLHTGTTSSDVLRLGGEPVPIVDATHYADPLLGTIDSVEINGVVQARMVYEGADPAAGQFARPTETMLPSGLTTKVEYYGGRETATHPITGKTAVQSGAMSSVQVGSGPKYGQVLDDWGHRVGTYRDGQTLSMSEYDDRGRLVYVEVPEGENAELSPERSVEFDYGIDGDPAKTMVTWTIGDRVLTETLQLDLFGRLVQHVDPSGVMTEQHYDARGSLVSEVTKVQLDSAWTIVTRTTIELNDALQIVSTQSFDVEGKMHGADFIGYDQYGRRNRVVYNNGSTVDFGYDPETGAHVETVWVDADGNDWSDMAQRSPHTGRLLQHTLSGPAGIATHEYEYDPTSVYLTKATLTGTGVVPSASWDYGYAYDGSGSAFCSGTNLAAALDGARARRTLSMNGVTTRLDYCYNDLDAPVKVQETTTPDGGTATSRDIPLDIEAGIITRFESASLRYNLEEQLVEARDGDAIVRYVRDAFGHIVEETIERDGEVFTRRNRSSGLVLDEHDNVIGQTLVLPGGVTVQVTGEGTSWMHTTQSGNAWWSSDATGSWNGEEPRLFSPDGEPISAVKLDPADLTTATGWRALDNGRSLGLATPLVVFGARLYVPTLGAFTTIDPVPNGSLTPYGYADNDPINFVDDTGMESATEQLKQIGDFFVDVLTHPVAEIVIVITLTVAMAVFMAMGFFPGAAVCAFLLFGYNAFMATYYFMEGDHLMTAMYAIDAVFSLFFFYGAVRMARAPNVAIRAQGRSWTYINKNGKHVHGFWRAKVLHPSKAFKTKTPTKYISVHRGDYPWQRSRTLGSASAWNGETSGGATVRILGTGPIGIDRAGFSYPIKAWHAGGRSLVYSGTHGWMSSNGAMSSVWLTAILKRFSSSGTKFFQKRLE
ncbi:MAG: RHS repeat-associated core domain-containing protein [Myxococcota bacterium]